MQYFADEIVTALSIHELLVCAWCLNLVRSPITCSIDFLNTKITFTEKASDLCCYTRNLLYFYVPLPAFIAIPGEARYFSDISRVHREVAFNAAYFGRAVEWQYWVPSVVECCGYKINFRRAISLCHEGARETTFINPIIHSRRRKPLRRFTFWII